MPDDVVVLVDQLLRPVPGGVGTYTRGLLQGLHTIGRRVTLGSGRGDLPELGFPLRTSRFSQRVLTHLWDRGIEGGVVGGARLVHACTPAAPYGRAPVVVTIHDLAWREVPEAFPARARRWHDAALRRAIGKAAAIVAPSERTAALLAAAGAARVHVINEGCDHLPPADQPGADALLRGLGVVTPYLLSVSTLEPRKNLGRLVEAFDRVRERLPEPWPLVIVGPSGWGGTVDAVEGVKLAGVVSDAVLSALYAGARCAAYVPLVEGWGLPAVEAMAACTPVVASPMPSTGRAALEVDPLDVDAIGAGLLTAAGDDRTRSELVSAGLLRAGELTWERAARGHVAVWDAVR